MHKLLLLLALLPTLSCTTLSNVGRQVSSLYPGTSEVTQDELHSNLIAFASAFSVLVTEAADRISIETDQTKLRRLALLWKIRMPPLAQIAARDANPRTGYIEMLTVAVAQRQYFEAPDAGATLFGRQQQIAVDASKQIESDALNLGRSFLPPDKLAELHEEVGELARQHPIRGEFLRESIAAGLSKAETGGAFDDIIGIPMAPFRAIAGVESGAQAIHQFNATAAQFTEIIDQLPQRMRWQMELLSYDLQEQGGVLEQSLKSFDTVAQSAERLSVVAENAPEDMRQTIVSISEELELRSATLKTLLAEYREAIDDTGSTADKLAPLIEGLAKTSEQLNQAGVAWTAALTEFNAPSPPLPPGAPPPKPFDITDYEKTAVAVRATAEELRALLATVQKTEEDISTPFADRLLRNGVILIAVFFASMLAYRWIAARIPPAR